MKLLIIIGFLCTTSILFGQSEMKTDTLSFVSDGKKLHGLLDMPIGKTPSSLVILIQGSGQSNIDDNGYYKNLRSNFVQKGVACYIWDKPGCGKSEGQFDYNQTIESSAHEAIAAIEELKHENIKGSKHIGLWGISRAGWICPLIIQQYPSISYWISVSGTDDKENFAYLLESNFRILGKSEDEIKVLVGEWFRGGELFRSGGTPEQFLAATQHLQKDSFCIKNLGYGTFSPDEYLKNQEKARKETYTFDKETGLMIYVPNFKDILAKVHCPVLAIFGENDCNVDWRKTMVLYNESIGNNKNADLTIKSFLKCNHSIMKCKTGAINEDLKEWNWQQCDGYFDTMLTWLKEKGFSEK